MAMTKEQQEDVKNGILDINSTKFWWDILRPKFDEYVRTYNTDPELNRTLEKAMNMGDSAMQRHKKDEVAEALQVFMAATMDNGYVKKHMHEATDKEKAFLRDMQKKTEDMLVILKTEAPYYPPKPKPTERVVEYVESDTDAMGGFNKDWYERNMDTLNESNPTKPELNSDKVNPGQMVGQSR